MTMPALKTAPNLLFMVGSLRAKSASKALSRALAEAIAEQADVVVADIGSLPLYNADVTDHPEVDLLIAQVKAADGVVFITPEYNYSVPGVLKNAIDWASRPAYQSAFVGKECFVISLSGGAMGGVRAQAHLKYILNGVLARIFPCQEVIVPSGNDKTVEGQFTHQPTLDFALLKIQEFVRSLEPTQSQR